ncbi:MAG: TrmH family RNA methyltransferase [Clostridia bacterium]|nr:TrmH family RNA methyltransferase [Clostridia bacterium]
MLQAIKPYKKEFDYSYTLGVFLTIELLKNQPQSAIGVLLSTQAERNSGTAKIVELAKQWSIPVEVNDKAVARLSPKENCYAIGIFQKFEKKLEPGTNHIVLVNPMDSGNLGTIMRTCLGFKLNNIAIIKPSVDVFDPKTVRASMGALFSTHFGCFDAFEDYQASFTANVFYPFMLGAEHPLPSAHNIKKEPFSLIFGNESSGLPESFRHIGTPVVIPHSDAIDSLNLSIAVSLAAYEFTKDSPH